MDAFASTLVEVPLNTVRLWMLLLAAGLLIPTLVSSETPHAAFARSWKGRSVVVRQALHSLVFNERGRMGTLRSSLREGLTVVTPHEGTYFQFDGRQGRDDIAGKDLQAVVNKVTEAYRGDPLEVRSYQRVEPLLVARYDPGVELVVKNVRVEQNRVKIDLLQLTSPEGGEDAVTSITVKWPAPISKSLSERALIENTMRGFVDVKLAP